MQKKNKSFGHSKTVYKSERNIIAHNQQKGADTLENEILEFLSNNEIDSSDSSISG